MATAEELRRQAQRDRQGLEYGLRAPAAAAMDIANLPLRAGASLINEGPLRLARALGLDVGNIPLGPSNTPYYDDMVRQWQAQQPGPELMSEPAPVAADPLNILEQPAPVQLPDLTAPVTPAPVQASAAAPQVDSAAGVNSAAGAAPAPQVDSAAGVAPAPAAQAGMTAYPLAPNTQPWRPLTDCELGIGPCQPARSPGTASQMRSMAGVVADQRGQALDLGTTMALARMMNPGMADIQGTMQGADAVAAQNVMGDPRLPEAVKFYTDQGMDWASAMTRAQSELLGSGGMQRAQYTQVAPRQIQAADAAAQRGLATNALTGLPYQAPEVLTGYNPFGIQSVTTGPGANVIELDAGQVIDQSRDGMLPSLLATGGQQGTGYLVNRNDALENLRRSLEGIGVRAADNPALVQARIAEANARAEAAQALANQRNQRAAGDTTGRTFQVR